MIDPVLALSVAIALGIATTVVFWPEKGLIWRWRRTLLASNRERIEDALKHLFDCEYRQQPCSIQSLAGALDLHAGRTADLLDHLGRMDLARSTGGAVELTDEGRDYALRVVRIHRLWESYYSDRTGLDAVEWHLRAEEREHRTTAEEADALEASLNHPRFDPHGDPIPTSGGEIIPRRGCPLTDLASGQFAEVVHVEDEPHAVYAQLTAEALVPGMRLRITEVSARRIRFHTEAEEHVLAPVVAANLWVVPLQAENEEEESFELLSSLQPGERGRVIGISAACRGFERRRMLDLGIIPGTLVHSEMTAPVGDPTAYRVRGALIALRREQARQIHIHRDPQEAPA